MNKKKTKNKKNKEEEEEYKEEEYTKIKVYTVQYVVSSVHRKRSPTEEQSLS